MEEKDIKLRKSDSADESKVYVSDKTAAEAVVSEKPDDSKAALASEEEIKKDDEVNPSKLSEIGPTLENFEASSQRIGIFQSEDESVAEFSEAPLAGEAGKPVEISADDIAKELSDEISEEEKARIEAAQKKAEEKYDVLGDRKIKKPSKFVARIVAVVIILLLVIFTVTKIPMFYNCMTPGSTETIENLLELTGTKKIEEAETGERIWRSWYTYNENRLEYEPSKLPDGNDAPMKMFENADRTLTEDYAQINLLSGKRVTASIIDELEFVTVIMYQFDSLDKSIAYGEAQADKYGGQHEYKDLLFFKLGKAKAIVMNGEEIDFVYDAWYNGGTYVEVYASNEYAASEIKSIINYNS